MIVFRNLETNETVEFVNEDSVGSYFLNEEKFERLDDTAILSVDIVKIKKAKKAEIDQYWDKMRVFNIRNGMTLPCKADQNWYDTISNTIDILKTNYELGLLQDLENATYNYSIIGTDKTIQIPYKVLQLIKLTISKGRAYCRVNCDQHSKAIDNLTVYVMKKGKPTTDIDYDATIEAINNYDYKADFSTKQLAQPVQDIVLSDIQI